MNPKDIREAMLTIQEFCAEFGDDVSTQVLMWYVLDRNAGLYTDEKLDAMLEYDQDDEVMEACQTVFDFCDQFASCHSCPFYDKENQQFNCPMGFYDKQ